MLLAVRRGPKRARVPTSGLSNSSNRFGVPSQILKQAIVWTVTWKPGDCINRNLETCQKPDTLNASFEPALPHYGASFPLPGEQAEPVKPRCMCELVLSRGVCCVRSACST
jgi:hypothetical protein